MHMISGVKLFDVYRCLITEFLFKSGFDNFIIHNRENLQSNDSEALTEFENFGNDMFLPFKNKHVLIR